MSYTDEQIEALEHAKSLLKTAGLVTTDLLNIPSSPIQETQYKEERISIFTYTPPLARTLTASEITLGKEKITREWSMQSIIEHPLGAIVEYPETGAERNLGVAHIFPIDPSTNFVNPKDNIQYSLGDGRGIHYSVKCYMLCDLQGKPVKCKQTKASCSSIKQCAYMSDFPSQAGHIPSVSSFDVQEEVFMKTLGFFCGLREQGCCISSIYESTSAAAIDLDNVEEDPQDILLWSTCPKSGKQTRQKCKGRLLLESDKFMRPLIKCEYFEKSAQGHLILRNLAEFDIAYLRALMNDNQVEIQAHEQDALSNGYGPLTSCQFTTACRLNRMVCPNWHRNSAGILERGPLINLQNCSAQFEIYEPHDLQSSPFILLVCHGRHTHPNPIRVKTPETISRFFMSLLDHLEWRLADATPRRILLDSAFMTHLQQGLSWTGVGDPTLSDIHPSLANFDHVGRLIDKLQIKRYPRGTGLEGAQLLLTEQSQLPPNEQYLRCIEKYENASDGTFYVIICMFKAMSLLLQKTQRPSIDTAFKRLSSWQEFEIEAWFSEFNRSIVVARAFITSQSAEVHKILFRRIFEIVEEDTGKFVHFRHIHGTGFDTVTADGHRGQALGLGLYCQDICRGMMGYCAVEWTRPLHALSATEHLARMYRYCFAHYTRHVHNLRGHVSSEVRSAMLSLASSEALPNLQAILNLIRSGGKKANDWLKDKESSDGMALAAISQPASKIPLDIWRAAPPTSNGNEQAHRNINRDGTNLTLLAGIMRGLQYDSRAIVALSTYLEEASLHEKVLASTNLEIETATTKLLKLQTDVQNTVLKAKRAWERSDPKFQILQKRLRTKTAMIEKKYHDLSRLLSRGSGIIQASGIIDPQNLFDREILNFEYQNPVSLAAPVYPNGVPYTASPSYAPLYSNNAVWTPVQTQTQFEFPHIGIASTSIQMPTTPSNFSSSNSETASYSQPYYTYPYHN